MIYTVFIYIISTAFIIVAVTFTTNYFQLLASCSMLIYAMVMWSIRISKMPLVKSISYENDQFYLQLKNMEIVVPFEDTKGIGIKTLDGIFELELTNPSQVGKQILFKPSLLYPLNFKKVDNEIARINHQIKKCKRNPAADFGANQLNSFN